ncbi:MAG: hypothetical protein PHV05_06315 [Candidatus Riflebacteria bacterium]|nr:hypothetical protein [Candidatus Riflebacteria bacterium]
MISSLFSPFNIGTRELKNRVIAAPPPSLLAESDGWVTPQILEYYQKLAGCGVCAVIVEGATISHEGRSWNRQLNVGAPDSLQGISRLAEKIRNKGALPLIQLFHGGINAQRGANLSVYGPSENIQPKILAKIIAMTPDKIRQTVHDYVSSATLAWNAGYSGIEIQAAEGSLLQQFLSPVTNMRTDAYSIEKSGGALFLQQIIQGIKSACPDLLLVLKISMKDHIPENSTLSACIKTASSLQNRGIDMFHLTEGMLTRNPLQLHTTLGKNAPDSPFAEDAQTFHHEITRPVILSGNICTQQNAGSLLKQNTADLISIGRTLNRDPDWLLNAHIEIFDNTRRKCLRCLVCTAASTGCPDQPGTNLWLLQ